MRTGGILAMATEELSDDSKVRDDGSLRIPERVRERLDLDPGDRLRWNVTEDGELEVEVVRQEYGVFEDAPVVSLGGAADDHDSMGLDD
jgi:AbrB family looped-hinge helix DNA binding protein